MNTRTIKLVVIGDSGVGKTSLRGQYISGRFSSGYRATIGADFITKTLPHPHRADESVTLQIWDTAGQERFSSLSTAFFRGADAVILMFDSTQSKTLLSLKRWWKEFKSHAPVSDEDVTEYCTVFVGNKTDLLDRRLHSASDDDMDPQPDSEHSSYVTQEDAIQFIRELIPSPPVKSRSASPAAGNVLNPSRRSTTSSISPPPHSPRHGVTFPASNSLANTTATSSIAIVGPRKSKSKHSLSRSRSQSLRQTVSGTVGTLGTTASLSIYHTPTSSVFDGYETAQSSPSRFTSRSSSESTRSRTGSPAGTSLRRMASLSLSTTSETMTITPRNYWRERTSSAPSPPPSTVRQPHRIPPLPPRPERHPRLFFTSAKNGNGVADVFQHIAERVLRKWEYDEAVEARRMSVVDDGFGSVIRLGTVEEHRGRSWRTKPLCCTS